MNGIVEQSNPKIKILAGVATVKIEVPIGTPMGGYMARSKPSEGVHDDLFARSLIIACKKKKNGNFELNCSDKSINKNDIKDEIICLCVADVVALEKKKTLKIKEKISNELGIPIENIMISVTHTHSGPRTAELFGSTWDQVDNLYNAIFESSKLAYQNLFEAELEYGCGEIKGVSYNRREFDKNSDIIDYEAVVLKVKDKKGNIRGIIYNFSNHCVVMNPNNLMITQDWPYYTELRLKQEFGDDIKVLFLQGTPGNINPINVPMSNPDHTWDDVKEIGDKTADQLISIVKETKSLPILPFKVVGGCNGSVNEVLLEMDDEDKAEGFVFVDIVEKDGQKFVSTYCQALKIGSFAIIGLPGEAFAEIGLNIKNAINSQGAVATMVVGYSNDYIGYFGTKETYRAGGYEMIMMSLSENEGESLQNAAIEAWRKINN
ncbi:MAG: neutral/alkaline non-lysosomal ceramidase N-terminal domain-containing protein [Promethearchaeota archaeon]